MNDYKSASIAGSSTKKPALKKNVGVYPFFAIEDKYAKGGRKATDAEWKLLARYKQANPLGFPLGKERLPQGIQNL